MFYVVMRLLIAVFVLVKFVDKRRRRHIACNSCKFKRKKYIEREKHQYFSSPILSTLSFEIISYLHGRFFYIQQEWRIIYIHHPIYFIIMPNQKIRFLFLWQPQKILSQTSVKSKIPEAGLKYKKRG